MPCHPLPEWERVAKSRLAAYAATVPRSIDCQFRRRVYKLGGGRRHVRGDGRAETVMFEGHDPFLVALSVAIAILGGYTGFALAARVRGAAGVSRRALLAGAAAFLAV